MPGQFLLAIAFGLIVSAASYRARFLTLSGAIATFALAVIVFGIGGWQWTAPILTFFVSSSLLSKFGRKRKDQFSSMFEKSSTRNWGQVAANGGVPVILLVFSALFPVYDFYSLYLGAIAAVTADTWGTEIGLLSKGKTVSILTMKPVSQGTSGGVSEDGVLGGVAGAALIALSGYFWYPDLRTAFIIVLAGAVGSLIDSILGGTLQGQYQCGVCGKTAERKIHCTQLTQRSRGFVWMNNDVVNGVCAVVGAVVVWVLVG